MEEQKEDWATPLKIGNLFFNRFGADEDAAFEMVGVYHLQISKGHSWSENEIKEKGMDINHTHDLWAIAYGP